MNPVRVSDRLQQLVNASEAEKQATGTRFTPQEILQQPASWVKTYERCAARQQELRDFLGQSGIATSAPGTGKPQPTVFLVGAGSSDYIGRAVSPLLRQMWKCEAWAVPSTDLLTNHEDLVAADRNYLWISFSRSGGSIIRGTTMTDSPTDQELLRRYAKEGSEAAFCSLVDRHMNLVYGTALRGINQPDTAADVAQNVFILLARKSHWLCGKSTLAPWLHHAALLEVRQWWRGEYRRQRRENTAQ